ncbi:MAG: hypothetical protein PVH12_07015 [Candidatus Bathyarchaeota archaeon]
MRKCKICGKNGKDLSLLSVNHKELGRVMVCQECWKKLWNNNRMICSTTGSCSTCPSCG